MVAQLRSRGKADGSSAEPEATRKTRKFTGRQQSERPSALRPTLEVQIHATGSNSSRQSTIHAIPQDQPSPSRSRVTRSKRANTPLEKLPSPAPRKRRAANVGSKDQPAKRQRSSHRKPALETAEEDEPSQLNQEDEEASEAEENALPEQDFLNNINSSLGINSSHNELPNLRPNGNAEAHPGRASRKIFDVGVPQIADSDENIALDDIPQEHETGDAEKNQASARNPEQPEVSHEETPASKQEAPQATQGMPPSDTPSRRRTSRRKNRRQSQKPTYGAPHYDARGVSPDLGSVVPQAPATQVSTSQQVHAGGDIYDVPSDQEQPSQLIVERGERDVTQAVGRRKTDQSKRKSSQPEQQSDQASSQAEEEQEEERNEESARKKDRNGDQEGEYEDDAQDSDNDEPAAEQEPGISDPLEDSLLLDAPPSGSQTAHLIPTAWIKRDSVQKLVWTTTYSGWMDGRKWQKDVLKHAKTASKALEEQPDKRIRSRLILAKLYSLYELCKNIPSSSKSKQLEYFREHTAQLSSLLTTLRLTIDEFISCINMIMEQDNANQVSQGYQYVTKLHRRIIPMLVLVLDQSFQAGCGRPGESTKKLGFQKGEFTVYLLQPLERAAGWVQRLSQVVESWYELHPPRRERDQDEEAKEHRRLFREATKQLKKSLEKARESINAIKRAPAQQRKVMQKDEAVRMERQADAQRRRDIQDIQMQRFLQSMQKIESSQPRPPTIRSYRQTVRSYHPVTSQSGLVRSQEPSDGSYFEKHGWYYWEDDKLLSLIRTTSHPNYEVFHQVLPNREPEELKERSKYLRMVMRDKYERKGIQPPGWCVDED